MIKVTNTPTYTPDELQQKVQTLLGTQIAAERAYRGDLTIEVHVGNLLRVVEALKENVELEMNMVISITAVHWPEEPLPYELVYHMRSLTKNLFLVVKTRVGEDQMAPSLTSLYKTANWQEREVFDMMGVKFSGHPDLRRILLPDPYPWHPLRKEFPVEGPDFPIDAYQTDAAGKVENDDFWNGVSEGNS